ncbi:MAG TPA: hypothetical protein VJS64_07410 [Pyrinomonadaceae bacterium]|nr:hypothetical protein [Pyrinomonadaceae bacterium]
MKNINLGRVVLGGLLAGLVLNVGEVLLNDLILGTQMQEFFARTGLTPPGTSFLVAAVSLTFLMGIVLVLAYALIRTRLGPGPKTAIVAGLLMWFGIYLYCGIVNGLALSAPTKSILITIVWGLVEYVVAALVGAWFYKEAQ